MFIQVYIICSDFETKTKIGSFFRMNCQKADYCILFPDTLSLGYKEHTVNTEKYVYYRKVQEINEVKTRIGN